MTNGLEIKKRRKALGKRQLDLSAATNFSTKRIGLIERGGGNPSRDELNSIDWVLTKWEEAKANAPPSEAQQFQRAVVDGFNALMDEQGFHTPMWSPRQYAAIKRLREAGQSPESVLDHAKVMVEAHRSGKWPVRDSCDFDALSQHFNKFARRRAEPQLAETFAAKRRRETAEEPKDDKIPF